MAAEENKEEIVKIDRRKLRKRTPRPNKTGKKCSAASAALKALWADPVWREQHLKKQLKGYHEKRALDPVRFHRAGVPDGMRREEAQRIEAEAKESARKTVEELEANGFFASDEAAAKEALEVNIAIMRGKHAIRERLAAASKVLEYTKSKPVAKSEVTVNKAEEWLAAVAAESKNEKADESGDTEDA